MSQTQNLTEVADGAELICEDLHIFGDVHQGSIIDAHRLIVKGATHSDASQFSKYAQIHQHKGKLRCHEAKIDILDGGEVHASNVTVDTCLGGEIYAQDVTINTLSNKLTVYASRSIRINLINGSGNKLHINYHKVPILLSKLELIDEDIEDLNFLLDKAKQNNAWTQQDIKDEIKKLQLQKKEIIDSIYTAKISIKNEIKGKNLISFYIDENNTISWTTDRMKQQNFYLEFDKKHIILHPSQTTITL